MSEKEQIKDKCPYCKKTMHWNQWSETWHCREHGRFGANEGVN